MPIQLCTVPGCPFEGRYCRNHQQQTFKPIAPIKREGDALKEELKIYRKEARKFITTHKRCTLKMKGCEGEAKCVHHSKGRLGPLLLDKKHWMASCYHCNLQVEIKDAEARSKGLKISKFKKDEPVSH